MTKQPDPGANLATRDERKAARMNHKDWKCPKTKAAKDKKYAERKAVYEGVQS